MHTDITKAVHASPAENDPRRCTLAELKESFDSHGCDEYKRTVDGTDYIMWAWRYGHKGFDDQLIVQREALAPERMEGTIVVLFCLLGAEAVKGCKAGDEVAGGAYHGTLIHDDDHPSEGTLANTGVHDNNGTFMITDEECEAALKAFEPDMDLVFAEAQTLMQSGFKVDFTDAL